MRGLRRRLVPVTAAAAGLLGVALAGCSSGGHPGTGGHTSAAAVSPAPTATGSAPLAVVTGCQTSGGTPVSSANALTSALASARPGETIVLAAGVYPGEFVASQSGTSSAPITLSGSRNAALEGESIKSGCTFYRGEHRHQRRNDRRQDHRQPVQRHRHGRVGRGRSISLVTAQEALETNWYVAWLRYVVAGGHA